MMKRIFVALLSFCVTVAVVVFCAFNAHDVLLYDWFGAELFSWPLAAVVMAGFVLGFFCGGAVVFLDYLSLRKKQRDLKRAYKKLSDDFDALKAQPREAALTPPAKPSFLALMMRK